MHFRVKATTFKYKHYNFQLQKRTLTVYTGVTAPRKKGTEWWPTTSGKSYPL